MTRLARVAALGLALAGCAGAPAPTPPREPFAWELPPPEISDKAIIDASRIHRATLENGLQILVLEDRRLPEVRVGLTALRGAGIESQAEAGVATFTASLMERGAGERDALALSAAVEALGADFGVNAGWDTLDVELSGLSRDFDTLFGLLADVVRRPRLAPAEAKRVAAEQRAAIANALDDPAMLADLHFTRALYDGHRFALPLFGEEASVARLTERAARDFHARVFTPSGAILWASGDIDPDTFVARARAAFADWQGPARAPLPPVPAASAGRRVILVDRPDLGQAQVVIGHAGIARNDERRLAVQLLNTAFGAGTFSSRLMARIRAKEGLTYSIYAQFDQRAVPGPFAVRSFTRVPEVPKLLTSTFEELDRVRSEPPAGAELEKARELRIGSYPLALETSDAVIDALIDLDVYGLPRDTLDTYRARMRALSSDELAQAARDLIHPEAATIVVVGPAAALRDGLASFGPVEIVAP